MQPPGRAAWRAAIATLACVWTGVSQELPNVVVELPLRKSVPGGPFVAELRVGTPLQRVLVAVDTASGEVWIPDADWTGAGFSALNSSSAEVGKTKRVTLSNGLAVEGKMLRDTVRIGDSKAEGMPMLLARNLSGPLLPTEGVGLLGIRGREDEDGFFDAFWLNHPEVPRTFRLELSGPRPRVLIGASGLQGPRDEGKVRYLGTTFTAQGPLWYVSVRAIGLSLGKEEPWNRFSVDFNQGLPYGAPTLLNSGVNGIRLGSEIYTRLVGSMPARCSRRTGATQCECDAATFEDDFPSISISFEAAENWRFLGLDVGADVIVCIPPRHYVRYDEVAKMCNVDIIDGGPHHLMYDLQAVILGAPLFRSAAVVLDLDRRRVGFGAAPDSMLASEGSEVGVDQEMPGAPCKCADPKNWFATGRRFSPKRVVVMLSAVSVLAAYIFIGYSPSETAQGMRQFLDGLCPSGEELDPHAQPLAGGQRTAGGAFPGSGAGGMAGGGGSQRGGRPASNRQSGIEMQARGSGGGGGGGGDAQE